MPDARAVCLAALLASGPAFAQERPAETAFGGRIAQAAPGPAASIMTPKAGTPLRRELMDAMRPTFEKEIGGEIEFVVQRLAVMGDWAYAAVRPQRPGGRPIDWNRTQFGQAFRGGSFDPNGSAALLRRSAGSWRVVEYAIGPTDVFWIEWEEKHKLPERLFSGR